MRFFVSRPKGAAKTRALPGAALALAAVVTWATLAAPASASDGRGRGVIVMTRNVYLGTELGPLFAAPSPPALFAAVAGGYANVQATNFPERADAIAGEIAASRPDLVALQEVALFRTDVPADGPASPATTVTYDFLELLLGALADRGLRYRAVAVSQGTDAELPSGLPPAMDVRLTIRDVVLVRERARRGVRIEAVHTGLFATNLTAPTALGPVTLPRGWIAVDVRRLRFVSTHLEAFSPAIQAAQAAELLAGPLATDRPVVLAGDLNSRADGTGTSTYASLRGAGFFDAWTATQGSEPGFTCCHDSDLREPGRQLDERIDYVLVRGPFRVRRTALVGDELGDLTPSGLWPSDHAGIVARVAYRRASKGGHD